MKVCDYSAIPKIMKFLSRKVLAFDLLGNTVVVPVVKAISERILAVLDVEKEVLELEKEEAIRA